MTTKLTTLLIPGLYLIEGVLLALYGLTNDDEGIVLGAARLMRSGEIPYIDFAISKQPLNLFAYMIWPTLIGGRIISVLVGTLATVILARRFGWWALPALAPFFVAYNTQARGEVFTYLFAVLMVTKPHGGWALLAMANRATTFPIVLYLGTVRREKHMLMVLSIMILALAAVWLFFPSVWTDQISYNSKARREPITILLYLYNLWPLLLTPITKAALLPVERNLPKYVIIGFTVFVGVFTIQPAMYEQYIQPGSVGTIQAAARKIDGPLFTYQNLLNVEAGRDLLDLRLSMGRFSTALPDDARYMRVEDEQAMIDRAEYVAAFEYQVDGWDLSAFEVKAVIADYGQLRRDFTIYQRTQRNIENYVP